MPFGVKPCGDPRYGKPSNRLSRRANLSVVTSLHYLNFYYRVNFPRRRVYERVELLWITSTYLVGMNESGNQKGNLSYLAGTKKRSDSLIQLIFQERGARADENDARALFLSNTAEERVELLSSSAIASSSTTSAGTFAKFRSRSHRAVVRVYDEAGNVIETHEHAGDFREQKRC